MTLTGKITLGMNLVLQNTIGLSDSSGKIDRATQLIFANGVGLNQADRLYSNHFTIAASGTQDLDLAGSLTDIFGAVITMARVKAIIIIAAVANVNNVLMGNAPANQFIGPFGAAAHTIAVKPGGILALVAPDAAGWVVTAGTADILRLANSSSGSGVDFDIAILGASA